MQFSIRFVIYFFVIEKGLNRSYKFRIMLINAFENVVIIELMEMKIKIICHKMLIS